MEDPVTGDPIARAIADNERKLRGASRVPIKGFTDDIPTGVDRPLNVIPAYDPDSPSRTHSMTLREVRAKALECTAVMFAATGCKESFDWFSVTLKKCEHYILTGEVR